MSRTHRKHASKSDLAKQGGSLRSQPVVGSPVAVASFRSGAGIHGRSQKASRTADKVSLRREYL